MVVCVTSGICYNYGNNLAKFDSVLMHDNAGRSLIQVVQVSKVSVNP